MVNKCFLILFVTTSFLSAKSALDNKSNMHSFVSNLQTQMHTRYAPSDWKLNLHNWDFDKELKTLDAKIDIENFTVKEFQREVLKFFNSTDDYHCSVQFFSTESSSLPFLVKKVEGEYLISYIDENKLDKTVYDISVGDKILYLDGTPVETLVKELVSVPNGASPKTEQSLAEITLTNRSGRGAHKCPRGPVMITVEKQGTRELKSYQLVWTYRPEKITEPVVRKGNDKQSSPFSFLTKNPGLYCNPLVCHPHAIGKKESFLPELGEVVWKSEEENTFNAYLFKSGEEKTIGYLRISHYMFGESQVEELAEILKVFEEHADLLVIDQLNNPGGNVFYLYSIISMFSDKPLVTPLHHHQLTQSDIMQAWTTLDMLKMIDSNEMAKMKLGDSLSGYPVTYQTAQLLMHYNQEIINQWMEGKLFTDPLHVFFIDTINPSPKVTFTKPILCLINELDFSGGDFFPAILQDNGRATLMGVKTSGAGGYVASYYAENLVGVASYKLTASLAIRSNGQPIENLGVTPDIPYELKIEDIRNNYKPFIEAIHEALNSL